MRRFVLAAAAVLAAGAGFAADPIPPVEVKKDDAPEVKAAKEIIRAEQERIELIQTRIEAGQFSGGASYLQLGEALKGLTDALEDAFPESKDRLPWYELRLKTAEKVLEFNKGRIERGVEEPQLLPQLQAERARAELALLKAKKKVK